MLDMPSIMQYFGRMETNFVQVGHLATGITTKGQKVYGKVECVREGIEHMPKGVRTLVDIDFRGVIYPCKIETVEIHGWAV